MPIMRRYRMDTYVVTNRRLDDKASRLERLTKYPSEQVPNELRLVHITKPQKQYRVEVLDDKLSPDGSRS